jgi:hypothetical protein
MVQSMAYHELSIEVTGRQPANTDKSDPRDDALCGGRRDEVTKDRKKLMVFDGSQLASGWDAHDLITDVKAHGGRILSLSNGDQLPGDRECKAPNSTR